MAATARMMVPLDAQVRDGLALIVDTLLPGTQVLPAGRAVGAHLQLLERVLDADPNLEQPLIEAGRRAVQSASCTLADLQEWSGSDVDQVVFALTAAYYLDAGVRAVLGYPGQERRPVAEATPEEQVTQELLAPVIARGPVYVPIPD